jgi:hypothetical protein
MRVCVTCSHERRTEIESEIIRSTPLSELERKYNISDDSLAHHRDRCIPDLIARARADSDSMRADNLIAKLDAVQREAWDIYHRTKGNDDGIALKSLARIENQIALAGKILGSINESTRVEVSVIDVLAGARHRLLRAREIDRDASGIEIS